MEDFAEELKRMCAKAKALGAVVLYDFAERPRVIGDSATSGSLTSGRSVPARSSAAANSGRASWRRGLMAQVSAFTA